MKHTLKTLLTTTVCMLPAAFGAAHFAESADQPGTSVDGAAAASVSNQLIATRPTSTLDRLLIVIRRVAGGTIKLDGSPKNFEVGFLDAKDVSNLSLASSVFYKLGEPILALAKAWRQTTDVIPRLLLPARIIPFDQEKFRFLRVNTDASFDNLLDIAFDVKFWTVPMSYENHAAYVRVINGNARFGDTEKRILRGLLPNATEGDAREAAYALKVLGMTPVGHEVRIKYHDKAAVLYERSADTQGSTSRDVQRAGDSLRALGDLWPDNPDQRTKYHVIAAAVYERIADIQGATPRDLQGAGNSLKELGSSWPEASQERTRYHARAAAVYERIADTEGAASGDVQRAVDKLKELGNGLARQP